MTTKEIIRYFAGLQPEQRFSRKELLSWMREVGLFRNGSEAAINLSLCLMLKNGELIKESWGTYILPTQRKRLFIPVPSKEIRDINHLLKEEFPYTNIVANSRNSSFCYDFVISCALNLQRSDFEISELLKSPFPENKAEPNVWQVAQTPLTRQNIAKNRDAKKRANC